MLSRGRLACGVRVRLGEHGLIRHRIYALWVKAPDVELLRENQAWAAPPVP